MESTRPNTPLSQPPSQKSCKHIPQPEKGANKLPPLPVGALWNIWNAKCYLDPLQGSLGYFLKEPWSMWGNGISWKSYEICAHSSQKGLEFDLIWGLIDAKVLNSNKKLTPSCPLHTWKIVCRPKNSKNLLSYICLVGQFLSEKVCHTLVSPMTTEKMHTASAWGCIKKLHIIKSSSNFI